MATPRVPHRLLPLAVCVLLALAAPAARAGDTLSVHAEFGVASDASNEMYYEDVFTDTTFLGRRLHGTPDSKVSGVASMTLLGRRGTLEYTWHPEVQAGNEVTRGSSTLLLLLRPDPAWRLTFEPRAEYSRDLSFGLDRRQALAAASARARRVLGGGANTVDLRLYGELMQTPRSTDPFLLAHRIYAAATSWSHDPLYGTDWYARYEARVRTFPDSTTRDHLEHQFEAYARQDLAGGHWLALHGELDRRVALRTVPGSRDRFVESDADLQASARLTDRFSLQLSLEGEGHWYDQPDSVLDFDYYLGRARLSLRSDSFEGFGVSIGPRAEWLLAPWNEAESFGELGGAAEFEWLSPNHWWLVEPGGGWHAYVHPGFSSSVDPGALHSSYGFAEIALLGDQALPGHLRARMTLNARLEDNRDPSQDSRGFYFSCDLRRLF